MISSTALDLPEHRDAVKEACISAGVFPIGMEHLPARDASGITVSLGMVEKADIYLDTIGLFPAADLANLERGIGECLSDGALESR